MSSVANADLYLWFPVDICWLAIMIKDGGSQMPPRCEQQCAAIFASAPVYQYQVLPINSQEIADQSSFDISVTKPKKVCWVLEYPVHTSSILSCTGHWAQIVKCFYVRYWFGYHTKSGLLPFYYCFLYGTIHWIEPQK